MGDSLIRLEDVHITLDGAAGAVKILKGISLDVAAGTSVAVLGPSGSGKSTLLAAVGGLEGVTSGKLTVANSDLTRLDEDGLALFRRHHVGIVFQSFHLLPTMTALENVAAPLELAGKADPFTRAERELAAVGLQDRAGHYPSQMSGGEQQRVALARALAADPALILADEPTGNLDGETGEKITELLFEAQRERGTTLLLVTHDEDLATRCDRIVRIRDGLIADDTLNSHATAAA
ncbi:MULTISPECIES: ATP-binding cassette domain-containing protein [unclassified Minwuia]|uniref:ABC transporter ATP-binding protein n=1 Tax=unclassified Minwuia TaxID=2618799 RepID=UPI002479C025|nr:MULTISPECIES: ATP-binding cassette domain-containing protein [unclassified Minwuia]